MKEIKVEDIIKVTGGELVIGEKDIECINFSKDTRTIKNGDIYIGIKGEKFDGNMFWKEALDKGALGAIIQNIEITPKEKEKYYDKVIIVVKDSMKALQEIAKFKRSLYNIPVIAVTGSVGKTSTKDIIASVVSNKYKTLKTEGNNNNNIGVPLTILKLRDHEAAVIEMGMNHLREIAVLTEIAKPTLSVITNIGTSHIGYLGSRENILKAKLEILEGMEKPEIVVNNDNDLLHKWYEENKSKIKIHTYGIKNQSDINASEIEMNEENSKFCITLNSEKVNIEVPVGGEHFIYNALCAAEVGKTLGLSKEQITKGIKEFALTKKRMDIKTLENGVVLINDSYNASYESMSASIKYLADHKGKRKIAVLGDMFELGKYSEELHEKVGELVAQYNIEILICEGEESKNIINGATKNGHKIETHIFKNNDEVLEKLKNILKEGDVVLVKASNGMKFYEICQKL